MLIEHAVAHIEEILASVANAVVLDLRRLVLQASDLESLLDE